MCSQRGADPGHTWPQASANRSLPLLPVPPLLGGGVPSPDTQVGTARVIASGGQHPTGVRADVPRPRLRDVQGAVFVKTDAGVVLGAQGGPILLPDVPKGKQQSVKRVQEAGGAAGSGREPRGGRALPRRHGPPGLILGGSMAGGTPTQPSVPVAGCSVQEG